MAKTAAKAAPAPKAPPPKASVAKATPKAAPAPEPEEEEPDAEPDAEPEETGDETGDEAADVSIHDELLDAAFATDSKFARKGNKEGMQTYLKRLVRVISDAPEEVWNALPEDAQTWYNEATEAVEAGNEIDVPDDLEAPAEPEEKAKTPAEQLATAAEKKGAKGKPKAEEAPKGARKVGGAAEPKKAGNPAFQKKAPGTSAVALIRQYLVADQKLTVADIAKRLADAGIEAQNSTISTTRAGTLATIEDVKALGRWK